jgi:hypothetical protein
MTHPHLCFRPRLPSFLFTALPAEAIIHVQNCLCVEDSRLSDFQTTGVLLYFRIPWYKISNIKTQDVYSSYTATADFLSLKNSPMLHGCII